VKADRDQLRRIAEELVAPLLDELRVEHRQELAAAQRDVRSALEALKEERARVGTWRHRIEAEAADIHRDLEAFRQQVAGLERLPGKLEDERRRVARDLDSRAALLEARAKQIEAERDQVAEFKRVVLGSWDEIDAGLRSVARDAEQKLRERGRREQDAVAAAGKQAAEVAIETRREAKRTESSIKSIAVGVMQKLEKSGG